MRFTPVGAVNVTKLPAQMVVDPEAVIEAFGTAEAVIEIGCDVLGHPPSGVTVTE